MNADEIESIIAKIQSEVKNNIFDPNEYSSFKESNRTLYSLAVSGEINEEIFSKFMNMKRKLEQGKDPYSIDVEVGQFMAERYIDPVVKNIPEKK